MESIRWCPLFNCYSIWTQYYSLCSITASNIRWTI